MSTGEIIATVVASILGSSGLFAFLTKLLDKKSEASKSLAEIKAELKENRLSQVRTEMLVMMNHYPEQTIEILRLGEKYFKDLHGDFYMTSLFSRWLRVHNIDRPIWFDEDA